MGDPNFDVSELTGRAQTLWKKCDEKLASYRMQCSQYGCVQMPAGLFPSQAEVEGIYDNWLSIPSAADFKWATDGLHVAMSKMTGSGFSADDSGGDRVIPANGDLVLVSGQGPLDPQTHEIRGKDIAEQTILTFANVAALLKAAGSSLEDVVKVNVYLSDMGNYHSFNAVYGDLFKEPYPVRTTVACGLLDILIEVDCLATVSRVP